MKTRALWGMLAVCLLSLPTGAHAVQLYALSNFGTSGMQLWNLDTGTLTKTLVGVTTLSNGWGLGDYNGRLFSYSQSFANGINEVVELNPNTGATTYQFDSGITDIGEGAITFDATGKGYLTHSAGAVGDLYKFDIGGTVTQVGPDDGLVPSMDGMDFNSSGVLYGLSQADSGSVGLYTIDTTDAGTTLIGNPTIPSPGNLSGLTFDANDNLFAIATNGDLWSLNASNGAGTLLWATGLSDVSGLSALSEIPEPSTLGLLGLCLVGLAAGRRRKGHA